MRTFFALLAVVAAAVSAPAALASHGHHSKSQRKTQTLPLYRADCAGVATATQQVGTVGVKSKGQNGNGGNARIDVRVSVTSGMPSTSYRIYLLQSTGTGTCSVAATDGVLTTNAKGKGKKDARFATGSLAAGQYAIQLVAPASATVPGPGPFTDVLTTQFGITMPAAPKKGHH